MLSSSIKTEDLQGLWPCANGCILGHGAQCSNLRGRTIPLYRVCIKCGEGDEAYIRQTHERSDPGWVAKHPMPEAPKSDPEAAAKLRHYIQLQRSAKTCFYRGDVTQQGCNCLSRCWAGPVGKGRLNSLTGEWEASLSECVECYRGTLGEGSSSSVIPEAASDS